MTQSQMHEFHKNSLESKHKFWYDIQYKTTIEEDENE